MANLNKVDIPIAVTNNSKLDLSCDHVTTMDFMRCQPLYYRHMMKGEHLNFDVFGTIRPAPMPVPTYGRMRCNLRGFFVPYRLVFQNWHAFYNDTITSNQDNSAVPVSVPRVDVTTIMAFFTSQVNAIPVTDPNGAYDFEFQNNRFLFTPLGRRRYKVFYSLGYDLIACPKEVGESFFFNALGLLAYAKIFVDWYANSQYLNSADILRLQQLFAFNDPLSSTFLTREDLATLFSFVDAVVYDSNGYFENAWDNPVAPSGHQGSVLTFKDPTSNVDLRVGMNNYGTPHMFYQGSGNPTLGTTYAHEALKKLTDFQKRHQLAGAREIDRVLAQFGIVTDYLKLLRSIYVGSQSLDINVGDIYATGNGSNGTEISSVGDYAGRGFGQGNKTWDYTCDEEGIFIVIGSILPSGGYYQGYDRNNRHLSKTDFFVPEFDGLGVQAIEKGEVYLSRNSNYVSNTIDYTGVFGFTGRYGEYKRSISRVSGDIALKSVMDGGSSWHLMRELSDDNFRNISGQVHSLDFTRGVDGDGYRRIFDYTLDDVDPFYCFFHFDVGAYSPCKPLFETYDFEEETKKMTMDTMGTKLN